MLKCFRLIAMFTIVLLITVSVQSKENEINPVRLGLKIGVPSLIGFYGEYVLPVMNNEFALSIDYSYIPLTLTNISDEVDKTDLTITYWNIGAKYYIFGDGRGLFAGLNYGNLNIDVKLEGIHKNVETPAGPVQIIDGSGEFDLGMDITDVRVGYRLIWGAFTLCPEIGYGFGKIDDEVEYKIHYQGLTQVDKFKTSDLGAVISEGFVGAVSLGFAF